MRKERGWNQTELAQRAKLGSKGYVSDLETGAEWSGEAFQKVAQAFGVEIEDLGVDLSRVRGYRFDRRLRLTLEVLGRVVVGEGDERVERMSEPIGAQGVDEETYRAGGEVIEIMAGGHPLYEVGNRLIMRAGAPLRDGWPVLVQEQGQPATLLKVYRNRGGVELLEPLDAVRFRTNALDSRWTVKAACVEHIRRPLNT